MVIMKGGKICSVIGGVHTGKYAQVPNRKQQLDFINLKVVFAEFFEDEACTIPARRADGCVVEGLIKISNLKHIGFYD